LEGEFADSPYSLGDYQLKVNWEALLAPAKIPSEADIPPELRDWYHKLLDIDRGWPRSMPSGTTEMIHQNLPDPAAVYALLGFNLAAPLALALLLEGGGFAMSAANRGLVNLIVRAPRLTEFGANIGFGLAESPDFLPAGALGTGGTLVLGGGTLPRLGPILSEIVEGVSQNIRNMAGSAGATVTRRPFTKREKIALAEALAKGAEVFEKTTSLSAAGSAAGGVFHDVLNAARRGADRVLFGIVDELKTTIDGITLEKVVRALDQAHTYAIQKGSEGYRVIFYDLIKEMKFVFTPKK